MAKVGLDSFLLDCHTNDNIAEIEAEYGIKGFAIIVRLLQKIYSEHGYYCEWIERSPLLFLSRWFGGNSGVDVNLIEQVVSKAIKVGIFNEMMFTEYAILTSERIQSQYFDVVKRRTEISVIDEYLLVSIGNFKGNVNIIQKNVDRNPKNVDRNYTSKVKESKVNNNNIVEQSTTDNATYKQIVDYLNEKTGKSFKSTTRATQTVIRARLAEGFTVEDFKTVIDKKSMQWKDDQKMAAYLRPETLFAAKHFESYLNEKSVSTSSGKKNRFCNFNQRNYDYDALEKQMRESNAKKERA